MGQNESRLVLYDVPFFLWLFGLVFAAVGAGIWVTEGFSVGPLLFLSIGLPFPLFTSVLTITADRMRRTLTLDYRAVLRHEVKRIPFDEIVGITVESVSGTRGRTTYKVTLKRKDGQLIPFRPSSSSGSKKSRNQARALRDFVGVPDFDASPAGMTYAALQPYIDGIHESDGVRWHIQPVGSARWHSPDFKAAGSFLHLAQKAEGHSSRGFLASAGSALLKQVLPWQFAADDTPGLDQAATMEPLDPALEPHFMALTNAAAEAREILNARAVALLSGWAGRYPLKTFNKPSGFGQLTVLFSPTGVYVAPLNPLQPDQVNELVALGVGLVKSQDGDRPNTSAPLSWGGGFSPQGDTGAT